MSSSFYITTAIPYVNSRPHIGFGLELVQADAIARHRRLRGDEVRFLTGTDDNSLKNVQAARDEGISTAELVDRNAGHFEALKQPFSISFDDFIRTGSDPRHAPGVTKLWEAAAAAGDLYKRSYEGRYCVGCEHFYPAEELPGGRCPEHDTVPQQVSEENWFFRLSRYADRLRDLIETDRLRIEPVGRKNEVLGLIDGGLHDFSVSRSVERAGGWGVPVPGDPSQVMYVWYDALGNYITALDYAAANEGATAAAENEAAPAYRKWWAGPGRRVHLIGKGIIRFHAVYWPAMLMSAGVPLPTDILVHDYLTAGGRKIGKSLGNAVDPVSIVDNYGIDALRWWLLREVPRVGDADFTVERMVARANEDLANGLGNLVSRVTSMVHKYRDGVVPPATEFSDDPLVAGLTADRALRATMAQVATAIDEAMDRFDLRGATGALWKVVDDANRLVQAGRPWELAKAERAGDAAAGTRLDAVLHQLVAACRLVGHELQPFLPDFAAAVLHAGDGDRLPTPRPLYPRLNPPE